MAKEHPRYEHMEWPDYEFREFPMMVYPGSKDGGKTPDPVLGENGKGIPGKFKQDGVVVNSDEELDRVLNSEEKPAMVTTGLNGPQRLKTPEDERLELIAEAETMGVQVDKRWGTDKLRGAIEAFKADEVV